MVVKQFNSDSLYAFNIDKYLVCEGRDMMSGGSGAYNILLKLKTIRKHMAQIQLWN
jgi:hypothetical protein